MNSPLFLRLVPLLGLVGCCFPHQGLLAQPAWPDPVAGDVLPYETTGLRLGPLLGRPSANSIQIWVRTREATAFEIVYAKALPLDGRANAVPGITEAAADFTGTVTLAGLEADTQYYYGVRVNGALADLRFAVSDPWPSFRTLPDATSCADSRHNPRGLFNVRFGVGHCASQDPDRSGGQYVSTPAYETLYRRHRGEIMFGIVNGDVIYEEQRDGTLEGIRRNYRLYFSRGRSFNRLFRSVPALFTFDDHDVGWDIHGCGQVGLGEGPHLIRDIGLRAYQEYLAWANFRGSQSGRPWFGEATVSKGSNVLVDPHGNFDRLDLQTVSTLHLGPYTRGAESVRRQDPPANAGVYEVVKVLGPRRLEIRPPAKSDETLPYSIGTHHYYDWRVSNCHFFALDTRGERSRRNPQNRADPRLFLLSRAQEQWLREGISTSDADFFFLISPDPWVIYHTAAHVGGDDQDDKGDGFPSFLHQRERLLAFLDKVDKPVLIFTGDVHAAASVRITDNVWEMMCGPLGSTGHPLGTLGNPPKGGKWNSKGRPVEIRWLSPFPNNLPYERIRNTFYGVVQVNNVLKVGVPSGTGTQWIAYDQPQVVVRWHDGYTGRLVYAESITTGDAREGPAE